MATGVKRVKYAFPMSITNLASGVRRDFAAETIYLPEITGRTFKAVFVDVWARQSDATAISLTSFLVGVKLGAVAFDDNTLSTTITNSGEHTEWRRRREVSSYFNANFGSGASQTMQVGVQFGAVGTINICVEVTLVYEYDTSATTRVKTVQIPLDSNTGLLTTSLVEIGTNQIPQLTGGGILPEASPVIRDWYLRIVGNEKVAGGTTDFALGLQIDADAEYTEGLRESALASSCFFTSIYSKKSAVPTTTTAHALKARCAAVTARFQFSVVLVVTYEYDHASSTQILNSIEVPISPANNDVITQAATTSADLQTYEKDLWIQEPGTPALVQSGIRFQVEENNGTVDVPFVVNVGAGAARTYTVKKASDVGCGTGVMLSHRIDAGGAGGAALTLARGLNHFQVAFYWTNAFVAGSIPEGCHVVLFLNYVSDKHADGDQVHNHTIETNLQDTPAPAVSFDVTRDVAIPEADYFLNSLGVVTNILVALEGAYVSWGAKVDASEGPGIGWYTLRGNVHGPSNELGVQCLPLDITQVAKRWTGDPTPGRMDIETSRVYRFTQVGATNIIADGSLLTTYHAIKWAQTFTDRNYPGGDGSGLEVTLHRDDTDELLLRATTSAGGVVTFTWFDDTIPAYAQSYYGAQPSAYRGRSAAKLMSAA
jgi:hypothetical protein